MDKKSRGFLLMFSFLILGIVSGQCSAQDLPAKWEDLTSADFVKAIQKAGGVCLLPMGSLEKSGPAQPLGTATYVARIVTLEVVKQEYAVVFPEYVATRSNSASIFPGVVAYSAHLQLEMLHETVQEMARNGCKKIMFVNAESGNNSLISEFMVSDLGRPHDYLIYSVYGGPPRMTPPNAVTQQMPAAMQASGPDVDGHGGEDRTSVLMAYYPSIVHPERAHDEPISGHIGAADPNTPDTIKFQTEISRLPTEYLGDPSGATAARGKAMVAYQAEAVVKVLRAVKADDKTLGVQKQYFEMMSNPLTK